MPHYFLHLLDAGGRTCDPEGRDLPDVDAAIGAALMEARHILAWDVRESVLALDIGIEIRDEADLLIHTLRIGGLLEIEWADAPEAPIRLLPR